MPRQTIITPVVSSTPSAVGFDIPTILALDVS